MVSALELSQKLKAFEAVSDELLTFSFKMAEFTETVTDLDGNKSERRPVAVIKDEFIQEQIRNKVQTWKECRDELHRISPERFPLNSALFDPAPTIVTDVESVQVYIGEATSVRKVTGASVIKRLKRMRKNLETKPEKAHYETELADIERDLELFEQYAEDEFKLRASNYTDVTLVMPGHTVDENGNPTEFRMKAHNKGIFLFSKPGRNLIFTHPNQGKMAESQTKRTSVYDHIATFPTCIPYAGKLYLARDYIEKKAELDVLRKQEKAQKRKEKRAAQK